MAVKEPSEEVKKERLIVKGRLELYRDIRGAWVRIRTKNNMVVNNGLALITDRLKDNGSNPINYIAVGTDSTAVVATDTTLGSELARKVCTDVDAVDNVLTAETIFGTGEAAGSWEEFALFNASSGGTMFNRINLSYTKTTIVSTIVITWGGCVDHEKVFKARCWRHGYVHHRIGHVHIFDHFHSLV